MSDATSQPQQPSPQHGRPQHVPHPQYPWASAPMVPQMRTTEPLEYHRLFLGSAGYRWYKPLLAVLVGAAYYLAISVVLGIVLAVVLFAVDPAFFTDPDFIDRVSQLDTQYPGFLAFALISIIMMIPAWYLAMITVGLRPASRNSSVALKLRWGFLAQTFGIAALVLVVFNGVWMLVSTMFDGAFSAEPGPPAGFDVQKALISGVLVLLLVPFQAAAEEIVFRGGLLQVLGSWIKNPWVPMILTSLLFAMAHLYDLVGLVAVGTMGFAAAFLTWRTGGLEAAISVHIVNNYIAFGVLASGVTGDTAQVAETGLGWSDLVSHLASLVIYVLLVELLFRRRVAKRTIGRVRVDYVPAVDQHGRPLMVPLGEHTAAGASAPAQPTTPQPQQQVAPQPQQQSQQPPQSSQSQQQSQQPSQPSQPSHPGEHA